MWARQAAKLRAQREKFRGGDASVRGGAGGDSRDPTKCRIWPQGRRAELLSMFDFKACKKDNQDKYKNYSKGLGRD